MPRLQQALEGFADVVAGARVVASECNVCFVGGVGQGDRADTGNALDEAEAVRRCQQCEPMGIEGSFMLVIRLLG
jgi:hypothetical protein